MATMLYSINGVKYMQEFILPDYLDRSKISKNENLDVISKLCTITKYMNIINETLIKIEFGDSVPDIDGVPLSEFVPIIHKDESLLVFLRSYKGYLENNGRNYIFEKSLTEALSETKLDLKVKYLPKEFTAFLDFKNLHDQDGDLIKGVFVDIRNTPSHNLCMGFLAYHKELNSHTIGHLNIPLGHPEESIEKIIKNHKEIIQTISDEDMEKIKSGEHINNLKSIKKVIEEANYYKHIKAVFNAILYINNSSEQIAEEKNIFSEKKSKSEAQKKIFTQKIFTVFGKDFTLPREYTCGQVGVKGHFRWQPYGPERSFVKHIYIMPHVRNYSLEKDKNDGSDRPTA